MKITAIRYRRLKSQTVGYGHEAVEAEAQVEDGEAPDDALSALKAWVDRHVDAALRHEYNARRAEELANRVAGLESDRDRLRSEVERNREILRQHSKLADLARANGMGEQADLLNGEEIPF